MTSRTQRPTSHWSHGDRRPARSLFELAIERFVPCPWPAHAGLHSRPSMAEAHPPLYTTEERARRDASVWTTIQGVLAPVQFLIFLVSLGLVIRYLVTGDGAGIATLSILIKTGVLYAIMITGSVWEKVVFGRWLFAPAFFWEDVVSIVVLALHTACLFAMASGWLEPRTQMLLALAAYAAYVINAVQFLLKLRAARRHDDAPIGSGAWA
jgi:3-vinyl bacteriochlorophyllide hydratase